MIIRNVAVLLLMVHSATAFGASSMKPFGKKTATKQQHFPSPRLSTLSMTDIEPRTIFSPKFAPTADLKYPSVISFGNGHMSPFESGQDMKFLLGGKGANLGGMSDMGLSVPPGFTITTEVCSIFQQANRMLSSDVWDEVQTALKRLEDDVGRKFGDKNAPLLVSVRSGAAISMPGMLDTVLNLGINDETVKGLSAQFGERFAFDSYRRFLNMYGDVVMGIPHRAFEEVLSQVKAEAGVMEDSELDATSLSKLVTMYKKLYTKYGKMFPQDPMEQLYLSISAVFLSWGSERAVHYREVEGITGLLGTAVNVQAMVFGNMGDTSGTGVCFTRNPNTGEKLLYGEYLINAQGEDGMYIIDELLNCILMR